MSKRISKRLTMGALTLALLTASGCSGLTTQQQRTLTGAGIGAAGGTVLTAIAGGSLLTGALVGGGAGALIGALTTEDQLRIREGQ